jgi:hypothetical protein
VAGVKAGFFLISIFERCLYAVKIWKKSGRDWW